MSVSDPLLIIGSWVESFFTKDSLGHTRRLTGEGVLSGVNALHDPFSLFLVQCIIILSVCRVLGLMGSRFHQPQVIFEIIGTKRIPTIPVCIDGIGG